MKYRVIGQNNDTGARQILELEAESKGAAERKASKSGMMVTKVEDAETPAHSPDQYDYSSDRKKVTRIHPLIPLLIVIALAILIWVFRAKLKALIGMS